MQYRIFANLFYSYIRFFVQFAYLCKYILYAILILIQQYTFIITGGVIYGWKSKCCQQKCLECQSL